MRVRREVLGDAHVDRARRARPTSPPTSRTSSPGTPGGRSGPGRCWTAARAAAITLTALVAGGHLNELAMHVRAAVRNGLSAEEIKEVLLQTAVYCGVPAANSAFAVAQRVIEEES